MICATSKPEQAGMRLYGFPTRDERRTFLILKEIQGVGPKAALSVLDVLSPAELAAAVGDLVAIGDIVLVKGSKGSRVSTVVDALRQTRHGRSPGERTD